MWSILFFSTAKTTLHFIIEPDYFAELDGFLLHENGGLACSGKVEDPDDVDEAHYASDKPEEVQVEEVLGPVLGRGQHKKKILEWYGLDLCLWESKYMNAHLHCRNRK